MVHVEKFEARRMMAVSAVSGDVRVSLDTDYGSPETYIAGGDGAYVVGWTNFNDDDLPDVPSMMGRAVRLNERAKRVSPHISLPGEYFASAGPISTPGGFGVVSRTDVDEPTPPLIRYYSGGGKQLTLPRAIGDGTNETVSVGTDRTGAAVVLTEDPNGEGPVRAFFLNPTGQVRSGPKTLAIQVPAGAPTGVDALYVNDLAVARDGTFWVSYDVVLDDGPDYCVLQRYDRLGRRAGPAINLSKWVGGASDTKLAATSQGGVVAAVSYPTGGASDPYETMGATLLRFSPSSALEAGAFNTVSQIEGVDGLAVDNRGVTFLAYTKRNGARRAGYAESGLDVMGRTFSSDLTTNQKPFLLSAKVDEAERDPAVASIGGGRFAVAWVRRTARPDDPAAPEPTIERDVYTRVFTVSDPKARPGAGHGPITGPAVNSLPFRSGWYYTAAYSFASGFVMNVSIAFVRIEGTPTSAVVKEVLIPSDDELAAAEGLEPVIQKLGRGSDFVPDPAEFGTNAINHRPVVWAPGTTFTVFSYHPRQPGFRVKGKLVKFSNLTTPNSLFGPFGPPRYRLINGPVTAGPGETTVASNIGMFNAGAEQDFPEADQIIYFLAKKGGYDWSMTFYRLEGTPEAALRVPTKQ